MQRAGEPAQSWPDGTRLPGVTRAPAAIIASLSTTAPSITQACMPTKARSCRVQACSTAAWPMVTSSPMSVGSPPPVTWMTVPSCTLVRAPMRMTFTSPRTTTLNQMPLSGPISVSPITVAFGATKAVSAIVGVMP